MIYLVNFADKYHKIIVVFFFATFLILGVFAARDYGIGGDEFRNRLYGNIIYDYVASPSLSDSYLHHISEFNNQSLGGWAANEEAFHPTRGWFSLTHGPVFEVLLVFLERRLGLDDVHQFFVLRHIACFIFFLIGSIFFFIITKKIFGKWHIGLLGSLGLFMSPFIFGYSFVSSMDISFMVAVIISITTMLYLIEKPTLIRTIIHSISCAIMMDIRIAGLFIPFLTFCILTIDMLLGRFRGASRKILCYGVVYIFSVTLLVIIMWPALWDAPVKSFFQALYLSSKEASRFPWAELYLGKPTYSNELPWHFIPVWIGITTPVHYVFLFAIGIINGCWSLRRPLNFYKERKQELILYFCFLIPILTVILFNTSQTEGWRQLLFVYPPFLIIAIRGLISLFAGVKKLMPSPIHKYAAFGTAIVFALLMARLANVMVTLHPYELFYYNSLVGGLSGVQNRFEMHWDDEYKQGLSAILKMESRSCFKVYARRLKFSRMIFGPDERARINMVNSAEEADYVVTNCWDNRPSYAEKYKKIWSRHFDGVDILAVYKTGDVPSIGVSKVSNAPNDIGF